jgi:hypothetical protein
MSLLEQTGCDRAGAMTRLTHLRHALRLPRFWQRGEARQFSALLVIAEMMLRVHVHNRVIIATA